MHPWKKKKLRRQRRKAKAKKPEQKTAPKNDEEPTSLYEKTADGYECVLCGHTLKTEKGIREHIEREHPAE